MLQKNKKQFKIVILGDSGVGKTSIQNTYIMSQFSQTFKPTIAGDFTKEVLIEDKKVILQIWDTAGLQKFQSLGKAFYRGADCCVLVYDITNHKTFDSLQLWRQEFIMQGEIRNPENFPFMVFGNKLDKANERQVSLEIAQTWCKQYGVTSYFEVSAQDSINIQQAFFEIAKVVDCKDREENFGYIFSL